MTVIRSVLRLHAAPGRADAVAEFYADEAILDRARAFAGCRDAALLRGTGDDAATYLVIADWDAAQDYQRWVSDPWRADVSRRLADLLDTEHDEPAVGNVFEFVPAR
ncbi:putative quinol monooxygenase [Jatrophihabitans sp. YIM 134969]